MASYRFLKDHFIGSIYYWAGETVTLNDWPPSADVDPLDTAAVQAFYAAGPCLPGLINSRWSGNVISAPATYWYQVSPDLWALTGLGSDQTVYPPVGAFIGRIE